MTYIQMPPGQQFLDESTFPLFAEIKRTFGFVPNFYKAQSMRPDLIEAETGLVNSILIKEGALSRREKEYLFLACSGANLNTYCVTAHCEIVRMLGIEGPEPEQIATDYTLTNLSLQMKALLSFALKLNGSPTRISAADIQALRTYGFTDQQIMEAVVMVGLAKFANFVSFGLGTLPDFSSLKISFGQEQQAAAVASLQF
jgi:uncharacterized peroxidase-related enzyme